MREPSSPNGQEWQAKLCKALLRRQGVRLGEATVASRQVHMSDIATPALMTILTGADAGRVFYGRPTAGEVIHLDIFHEVADVDHRRMASALQHALPHAATGREGRLLDYFDLVTGTGGGRVTGDLSYGRKESLRAAHRNHVHVAGLLPDDRLSLLLPLVAAVEEELGAQGVAIRRVERLCHIAGSGGTPLDLSHYTDESDSWLRGEGALEGGAPSEIEQEQQMQALLDLAYRLGSPDEVQRVLDDVKKAQGWNGIYGVGGSQAPFVIKQLEEQGLIRREVRGLRLTEAGHALANYLQHHLRDVKLRFRKLIRRVPASGRLPGFQAATSLGLPSAAVRSGPIRGAAPVATGEWLGELAVVETVLAALKRTHLERLEQPSAPSHGLRLERADVHLVRRTSDHPLHICLLIDASASMAGRRILAAKHLARHLLVSTRDRIAVTAFQERDVRLYVPFTRDWNQVEEGLSRLQPMGLTPMAHGLVQALELMRTARMRRALLLLITDGIPTVPKWTIDPLADGLEAARQIRERGVPFGCIGLQPSRRYLEELTRVAKGTLHVVDELHEEALIAIAHHERYKTIQKLR